MVCFSHHILKGKGCPKCSKVSLKTTESYRSDLLKYPDFKCLGRYQGALIPILHEHICGFQWKITPGNMLGGTGCPNCYLSRNRKSTCRYEQELERSFPDYESLEKYINSRTKILHKHTICGYEWSISPNSVLRGNGCPKCKNNNYSKIAIEWLESTETSIQHAMNGGEYRIPNTRFHVDGFDSGTNTIYEFLGDVWHGNPGLYEDDEKCQPFNDKTAKELQNETEERFKMLRSLGYDLVYIWETDYRMNRNG